MKKLFSVLLLAVLVLAAANTAFAARIGISMPTQSLQRWNQDGANMKERFEAVGYEVDLQFANNNVALQVSQVENMILNGADVLVISAIDGASLGSMLQFRT